MNERDNRPRPQGHMARGGALVGWLIASVYAFLVAFTGFMSVPNTFTGADAIIFAILVTLLSGFLGAIASLFFGALPGALLGWIQGWVLSTATNDLHTPEDIARNQRGLLIGTFLTNFSLVLFPLLRQSEGGVAWVWVLTLGTFIAGGATIALYTYLQHLGVYLSLYPPRKQKNKRKRQPEPPAHLLDETDSAADNEHHTQTQYPIENAQAQETNAR